MNDSRMIPLNYLLLRDTEPIFYKNQYRGLILNFITECTESSESTKPTSALYYCYTIAIYRLTVT